MCIQHARPVNVAHRERNATKELSVIQIYMIQLKTIIPNIAKAKYVNYPNVVKLTPLAINTNVQHIIPIKQICQKLNAGREMPVLLKTVVLSIQRVRPIFLDSEVPRALPTEGAQSMSI